MLEFQNLFHKPIVHDDILGLVKLPVRKISKFDIKAADEKIRSIETDMEEVKNNLDHLVDYTVRFFEYLKKKYGGNFPRRTEIAALDTIQAAKVVANNAKLYINAEEGFIGTGAQMRKDENAHYVCECSDIDDIIVFLKSGIYKVVKSTDKLFVGKDIIHTAVFHKNDERTVYNVVYRDGKDGDYFVKRFSVTGVTRDRDYDLTQGKEGSRIVWFTSNGNGEAEVVNVYLRPKPKLKRLSYKYDFSTLAIKGRGSRGNTFSKNAIRTIQLAKAGVSTIGGKNIWFDTDINRLNEDGRGLLIGEFFAGDRILLVFKNGTFQTSSFDLTNHYQGEILLVEKYDSEKVFSALYFDGSQNYFYVKRFCFEPSDNGIQTFISDSAGSRLVGLSTDKYPQAEIVFGGKNASRPAETLDVEQYIACKGIGAKGKRVSSFEVASVNFVAPLEKDVPSDTVDPGDLEEAPDDAAPGTAPETESEPASDTDQEPTPKSAPEKPDDDAPDKDSGDDEPIELTLF